MSWLVLGRAATQIAGNRQAVSAEEAGHPQRAAGPAGTVLRAGFGMAGAGCGVVLGLCRACWECVCHARESAHEASIAEEQTLDSTELQQS